MILPDSKFIKNYKDRMKKKLSIITKKLVLKMRIIVAYLVENNN